jgi:signal transduction histidine kinase
MEISDDGKGFDAKDNNRPKDIRSHAGIKNMQQRADLINGKTRILSQPQKGTTVIFEIPINPSYARAANN